MTDLLVIVGARPNFIKAAPIVEAAKKLMSVKVAFTGQHDSTMADTVGMEIDHSGPYVDRISPSRRLGRMVDYVGFMIDMYKPRAVLVVGDVDSTLAGALAAHKAGVMLIHYEAGLRSGDMTMPEERNRIIVDDLSDVLLCTTYFASQNLMVFGDRKSVVGNTMIDTLRRQGVVHRPKGYVLVTAHRPALVDDPGSIEKLSKFLHQVARKGRVIWVTHPRVKVPEIPGVSLMPNLPYAEFIELLSGASCVVTDSGGVSEEANALGIPGVVIRSTTERPEVLVTNGGTFSLCPHLEWVPKMIDAKWGAKRLVSVVPTWADGRAGHRAAERIFGALGGVRCDQ